MIGDTLYARSGAGNPKWLRLKSLRRGRPCSI